MCYDIDTIFGTKSHDSDHDSYKINFQFDLTLNCKIAILFQPQSSEKGGWKLLAREPCLFGQIDDHISFSTSDLHFQNFL